MGNKLISDKHVDDIFYNLLTGDANSNNKSMVPSKKNEESYQYYQRGGADELNVTSDELLSKENEKSPELESVSDINNQDEVTHDDKLDLMSTDTMDKLKRNFYNSEDNSSSSHTSPLKRMEVNKTSEHNTSDLVYSVGNNSENVSDNNEEDSLDTDKLGDNIFNMGKFEEDNLARLTPQISSIQSDDEVAIIKNHFKKNSKYS